MRPARRRSSSSLAVCLGLLMSTRLLKRFGAADLRVTHETLSLATIVAIAIHGLTLIGDGYLHPSLIMSASRSPTRTGPGGPRPES